tara:strand:+ start:62 stop:550 length:489 start_codon:yes stop_codon:yes gene_type:complete
MTYGAKLSDAILFEEKQKMWPTPRASAAMAENTNTIQKRIEKKGPLGAKLEERVAQKMFPTPKARDWKDSGSIEKLAETKSQESLMHRVAKQMFLTPTANEDAAGRPGNKQQKMLGNSPEVRNTGKGALNADWVEWLMGFPHGWTNLTSQELQQIKQEGCKD